MRCNLTTSANAGGGTRTHTRFNPERILNPLTGSRSVDRTDTCGYGPTDTSNNPSNAAQNEVDLAMLEALGALPDDERPAVVAHVIALGRLSPAKRAAILTITES